MLLKAPKTNLGEVNGHSFFSCIAVTENLCHVINEFFSFICLTRLLAKLYMF